MRSRQIIRFPISKNRSHETSWPDRSVPISSGKFVGRQIAPGFAVGSITGTIRRLAVMHDFVSAETLHLAGFDELLEINDPDFAPSGLKVASVVRIGRLAVAEGRTLLGSIGQLSDERLQRIKQRLAHWLTST